MPSKNTPESNPTPVTPAQPGPRHSPFSWLHSSALNPRDELVATTYDVCRGVETCLEILMNEQLRLQGYEAEDDPALFSTSDTERLLRLALVATRMLANEADLAITDILRRNRKEGK